MKVSDNGGGDFIPAPIGNHIARCIKVIDLGTQKGEYLGKVHVRRQVTIAWELPNELMETGAAAGKPFIVSKTYTASVSEKASLRKDLEMWRGKSFSPDELKGFDLKNVLGRPCMVSVVHTDSGKAKVAGVASVPKGMEVPAQVNEYVHFDLEEFELSTYENLGKWHKEMIAQSPEYIQIMEGAAAHARGHEEEEDDIPF